MTSQLIAKVWQSYRDEVIPEWANATQVIESRRAFYAGAEGMLSTVLGILDPGADVTDRDLLTMEAIQDELKEFVENVKAGRA